MSINLLDIKKVIIFSLLQYSTTMVLKSPEHYTLEYMKKQPKTTFYIRNPYKDRRNLDYNFKDWEEKKPDVYDYLLLTTNQSSTTASDILPKTTPQTMFYPEMPPNPTMESSQYNTLSSSSATYLTLPSAESIPDTSFPYNTTTTTLIPEISTENIITVTTTASSTVILIDPVIQSIRNEIDEAKETFRGGYFTASVYILLKIIEKKKSADIKPLLDGFQREFDRLASERRLDMFGPMISSVFAFMVKLIVSAPVEVIQLQSINGQEIIENKKEGFQKETKAVFDIVDLIYVEEDCTRIVESLKDIQNFPNVSKRGIDVAEETLEAFILVPYTRIVGTNKEKIVLMEIYNALDKRIVTGEFGPMRRYFRKYFKISTKMKTSSKNITKLEDTKITKMASTAINSSDSDYRSYVKDQKIMKSLGHKIKIDKDNLRQSKRNERKFKMNKQLTSTIRTTMNSTTRFTGRYFSKIRKLMDDDNFEAKKYLLSNGSSNSDDFYSDSDDGYYGTDAIQTSEVKSLTTTKLKNNITEAEEFKIKIKDINDIKRFSNKSETSNSKAEAYFQVNLNDALFHINNITIDRRSMKTRINKLRNVDSFSDEEAILKGNIYKVFGYNNDFAKQLRTML